MEQYLGLIPRLRWQDVLDILIVAYVIYRIALLIRGTRTMQMVVGLLVVAGAFVGSQLLGLFTLNWLLNNFLGSLFVILVVIFQSDIRRALTRVGTPIFPGRPRNGGQRRAGAGQHGRLAFRAPDRRADRARAGGRLERLRRDRPHPRRAAFARAAGNHLHARLAAARRRGDRKGRDRCWLAPACCRSRPIPT